jgi:hypothetical protein
MQHILAEPPNKNPVKLEVSKEAWNLGSTKLI